MFCRRKALCPARLTGLSLGTGAVLLAVCALVGAETIEMPVGVTAAGSPIHAMIAQAALDPASSAPSILLVAGLDGADSSVDLAAAVMRQPGEIAYSLSVLLNAFPDRAPEEAFPPSGAAYHGEAVEAQYLWRFVGTLAPDLVVDLRTDERPSRLAEALRRGATPAGVGRVGAEVLRIATEGESLDSMSRDVLGRLAALARDLPASHARRELRARLQRSPLQVARILESEYGHALETATYIPALALVGRLRLGDLNGTSRLADVERIVRPYLHGKPSLGDRPTGSHVSGHLVFAELFGRTGEPRYLELAKSAAELGFNPDGTLKPSMPFHNEMSDSVFMGCAILARVGGATGESRYFRMALRHLRFMQALDLRPDGLYRHSPLDHAAWGRGNGFPALGLALALSAWPEDDPGFAEVLESFRAHIAALARHQDPTGAWHQVVDRPESYREFTSTAMIGFAVTRGLRRGWLDRDPYEAVAEAAWRAVNARVKSDATLVDVCRSTGRQDSLRAYLDREAILGRDDRGGAMALLAATERAFWRGER